MCFMGNLVLFIILDGRKGNSNKQWIAQWTRTKFGIFEIHSWSDTCCKQVGSYTSSEQLKMKPGTWGIKRNPIFDSGTFGGSNHPPKVTLVVWLVCHSNIKLAFYFLVTIICLLGLKQFNCDGPFKRHQH